jgi:hypothetical protein
VRTRKDVTGSWGPGSRFSAALIAVIVTFGVIVTVGASSASIPDSSGVIHGCYKTAKSHQLSVIDTAKTPTCTGKTAPLNWSPVNILAGHHDTSTPFSSSGATILTLTIPVAGSYAVSAKVSVINGAGTATIDQCTLVGPTVANKDVGSGSVVPGGIETLPLQVVDTFSAGTTATLSCNELSAFGSQAATVARIIAIPATTLINSSL